MVGVDVTVKEGGGRGEIFGKEDSRISGVWVVKQRGRRDDHVW